MNKQSFYAASRPVLDRFLLLLMASASMYAAQAQHSDTTESGITDITVQPAGIEENMYLLRVQVSNSEGKNFCITVSEPDDDNSLYEKVYNDKQFTRLFKVPANRGTLNFIVTDLTNFSSRSFSIDTNVQPSKDALAKGKD